jgi:gas vesicle protein
MENQKNLIGGILIGGAIGIVAGLLLAPQTGKQMRNTLAKKSGDLKDSLVDAVTDSLDSFRKHFNNKIDDLADQTKGAVDTATDKIANKARTI